jgi:magnesium-transporting ATPase (P-type)
MYVCMYACMHVVSFTVAEVRGRLFYMHSENIPSMYVCKCAYMSINICACVRMYGINIHTFTYMHTYIHTYVHIYTYMYPYVYVHVHTHTYRSGSVMRQLPDSEIRDLVEFVRVFARMSPTQKEDVLVHLNAKGHHTLMCGDGTNDVGALKASHVGVALLQPSHVVDAAGDVGYGNATAHTEPQRPATIKEVG